MRRSSRTPLSAPLSVRRSAKARAVWSHSEVQFGGGVSVAEPESSALVISIVALIVAVVAAAFAGWQAVTAHLARTTSRPAAWTIARVGTVWRLYNVGGSIASGVRVSASNLLSRELGSDASRTAIVLAPIPAGADAVLTWQPRTLPDPTVRFRPPDADDQGWSPLPAGHTAEGSRFMVSDKATVEWRDDRGKSRRARVRLR